MHLDLASAAGRRPKNRIPLESVRELYTNPSGGEGCSWMLLLHVVGGGQVRIEVDNDYAYQMLASGLARLLELD